jgi:hypothetical protein
MFASVKIRCLTNPTLSGEEFEFLQQIFENLDNFSAAEDFSLVTFF